MVDGLLQFQSVANRPAWETAYDAFYFIHKFVYSICFYKFASRSIPSLLGDHLSWRFPSRAREYMSVSHHSPQLVRNILFFSVGMSDTVKARISD